jgi:hypothetical protein
MAATKYFLDYAASNQDAVIRYQADAAYLVCPMAYFTTNDINTNLETKVAELQKQLEALTRQNQTHQRTRQGSRPPTTTNRGAPTDQWRTWTFWCHTHGANLTHNSNACSRPKNGHKLEATQRNPMGGNSKRDYLTGQWCNPVTNSPQATPNTAA